MLICKQECFRVEPFISMTRNIVWIYRGNERPAVVWDNEPSWMCSDSQSMCSYRVDTFSPSGSRKCWLSVKPAAPSSQPLSLPVPSMLPLGQIMAFLLPPPRFFHRGLPCCDMLLCVGCPWMMTVCLLLSSLVTSGSLDMYLWECPDFLMSPFLLAKNANNKTFG